MGDQPIGTPVLLSRNNIETSMSQVAFEPTVPVLRRPELCASYTAQATGMENPDITLRNIVKQECIHFTAS
jgi:hypothetical protein